MNTQALWWVRARRGFPVVWQQPPWSWIVVVICFINLTQSGERKWVSINTIIVQALIWREWMEAAVNREIWKKHIPHSYSTLTEREQIEPTNISEYLWWKEQDKNFEPSKLDWLLFLRLALPLMMWKSDWRIVLLSSISVVQREIAALFKKWGFVASLHKSQHETMSRALK